MFEGFANIWTPVELSRRLGRRPKRVWVAGERVVLFRGPGGRPGALVDRCPHRGAALSLGRVVDGCVECPFHGWRFAADGTCRAVPLNALPSARRRQLGATPLPVREEAGLLWLFTRPGTEAPGAPVISPELADGALVRWTGSSTWHVHWSRAMENALDFPHLPFVHRRSIGLRFRRDVRAGATMSLAVQPTATGMHVTSRLGGPGGGRGEVPATLEFVRPNGMRLRLATGREERWLHLWCVPMSPTHTRILMATQRTSGRLNPFRPLLNLFNQYIGMEDRRVAESLSPSEVPPPLAEKHVPTDRPTLLFRRYYLHELQGSSAELREWSAPRAVEPEVEALDAAPLARPQAGGPLSPLGRGLG